MLSYPLLEPLFRVRTEHSNFYSFIHSFPCSFPSWFITGYSSPGYIIEPCCLFVPYITALSANPKHPIHPSPTHLSLGDHKSLLSCESVSVPEVSPFASDFRFHICTLSRFSHVWHFVILWTVASQAPLSVEFSRQEHWSGLPLSPPGDLPCISYVSCISRQVLCELPHKWYQTVFVSLLLTLSMKIPRSIHVAANGHISFFFFTVE